MGDRFLTVRTKRTVAYVPDAFICFWQITPAMDVYSQNADLN